MAGYGPDPAEFLDRAQRMLRELFGDPHGDADPWRAATRHREPSSTEQRENLTFALATRAVEALEDLALNVAAIRQRLERTQPQAAEPQPPTGGRRPEGAGADG